MILHKYDLLTRHEQRLDEYVISENNTKGPFNIVFAKPFGQLLVFYYMH